jgi:hypothetical protein
MRAMVKDRGYQRDREPQGGCASMHADERRLSAHLHLCYSPACVMALAGVKGENKNGGNIAG